MSLLNALKAIGFDQHELECVWREDPVDRLERRQSRLKRALRQRCQALVRRRLVIESLKGRLESAGRVGKLLQRHEDAYRTRLDEVVRLQRKLARCQERLAALRSLANAHA